MNLQHMLSGQSEKEFYPFPILAAKPLLPRDKKPNRTSAILSLRLHQDQGPLPYLKLCAAWPILRIGELTAGELEKQIAARPALSDQDHLNKNNQYERDEKEVNRNEKQNQAVSIAASRSSRQRFNGHYYFPLFLSCISVCQMYFCVL